MTIHEPLPNHVDAILLYRGDNRHAVAANWLKSGFADRILLSRRLVDRNVALGIIPPNDTLARMELHDLDVNDDVIVSLDDDHSRGEWRHLRHLDGWLQAHPATRVVILCESFDSRRTRYAINSLLSQQDAQRIYVRGLPSYAFDEQRWWRSRLATGAMFDAALDSLYTRLFGEDVDEPITWDSDAFERSLKLQ